MCECRYYICESTFGWATGLVPGLGWDGCYMPPWNSKVTSTPISASFFIPLPFLLPLILSHFSLLSTIFPVVPLLYRSLKSNIRKWNLEREQRMKSLFCLVWKDKLLKSVPHRRQNKNSFLHFFSKMLSTPNSLPSFFFRTKTSDCSIFLYKSYTVC